MHVVPLVVHGGATQGEDGGGVVDALLEVLSLGVFNRNKLVKSLVACLLNALGNHIHGLVEGEFLPLRAAWSAIQRLGTTQRVDRQLETGGALGTERAAVDRTVRV